MKGSRCWYMCPHSIYRSMVPVETRWLWQVPEHPLWSCGDECVVFLSEDKHTCSHSVWPMIRQMFSPSTGHQDIGYWSFHGNSIHAHSLSQVCSNPGHLDSLQRSARQSSADIDHRVVSITDALKQRFSTWNDLNPEDIWEYLKTFFLGRGGGDTIVGL